MKNKDKMILIGYYERDSSIFRVYFSFNYKCTHEIVNALEAFIENYPENPEAHDIPLQSYKILNIGGKSTRRGPLSINKYLEKIKHEASKETASSRCPKIYIREDTPGIKMLSFGVYHEEF